MQYVYDTIDRAGNVRLCKALDDNKVNLTAKILTPQSWEQSINTDYKDSQHCANELWATSNTRNYEDTQYPGVANFRQQMAALGHGDANSMSEWALEGWAGGSGSPTPSRRAAPTSRASASSRFVNAGPKHQYDAHGVLTPRYFIQRSTPEEPSYNCINVARWVTSKNAG